MTLLGQNVNSYRDLSESTTFSVPSARDNVTNLRDGFKTVYKPKVGGRRFSDLLDRVSQIDPEMRIRFTSPHPKDFPDEVLSKTYGLPENYRESLQQLLFSCLFLFNQVLQLIKERHNICKQLHMPAQSGSSSVLQAMRRGYTREAYIELIHRTREIVPGTMKRCCRVDVLRFLLCTVLCCQTSTSQVTSYRVSAGKRKKIISRLCR